MAQNGFTRRTNSATRTYPGTASRLVPLVGGIPPSSSSTSSSSSSSTRNNHNHHHPHHQHITTSAGSEPTVFIRPLSRSQLAPVHHVAMGSSSPGGGGGGVPPPLPPARPISLDQPRPSSERNRNLYLGAPILQQHHNNNSSSGANNNNGSLNNNSNNKNRVDSSVTAAEQVRLPSNSRMTTSKKIHNSNHHHHNIIINSDTSSQADVVTTQPTKRSLLKSESMDGGGGGDGDDNDGKVKLPESSIVCPYCRKCRCEACATPRPLPSRWICSKSVYCGPESLLDLLTCLCCVKAIFYHCSKNHEPDGGVMCADDPCSCSPHRKFWRWSCITAMSLLLPPLCLYWPCKGCIILAEKVYQKYHNNGCNCRSPPGTTAVPSSESGGGSGGGGLGSGGGGGGGELGISDNILRDGGNNSGGGGGVMDNHEESDHLHHHLHPHHLDRSASSHHFSHPSSGMTASGRIGSRSNKLLSSSSSSD